jgi:hypothetical protein
MAYGLLGGILGSEDDKPDATPSATPAGAEAFAAAVAAKISGSDPEVARKTVDFLSEQTQLLKAQKECLKDEHALRLAHLRSQVRAENTRQIGMRVRIGLHAVIALVAIGVAIGAAIMIHDALGSRSVVIDAFDIAPNVAAQVPSGKIVAAGLLDVLTRIQAATRSRAEHRSLASAWTNDIAIDVPETGISIGQLQRTMKARFGRDQHIDGDLAQSESGGLALTVRGTGILPKTFIGEARHLDKLLTEAGEYAYGQ